MSDDLSNEINLENSGFDDSKNLENSESVDNPEFEMLLLEATKTKEQERAESSDSQKKGKGSISDAEAAKIAASGIGGVLSIANQFGGYDIELNEDTAQLAISLFCPLVKKYGNKFDVSSGSLERGWMPEIMAIGGVGVVGFTAKKQINAQREEFLNGDKSEHS